jgi:hypothetical protein
MVILCVTCGGGYMQRLPLGLEEIQDLCETPKRIPTLRRDSIPNDHYRWRILRESGTREESQ